MNQERYEKGLEAKELFMQFINAECDRIAVENPIPTRVYELPKYTQIIRPYEHGHPYSKKTCLWLKGLPKLKPTKVITENVISWVSGGSKNNKGASLVVSILFAFVGISLLIESGLDFSRRILYAICFLGYPLCTVPVFDSAILRMLFMKEK